MRCRHFRCAREAGAPEVAAARRSLGEGGPGYPRRVATVHRFDIPDLADDVLFAYARTARSLLRRFALYGLLLYVPLAVLPLLFVQPLTPAARAFVYVMTPASAALIVGAWGLGMAPRFAARLTLIALIPLFPVVALVGLQLRTTRGMAGEARKSNLFTALRFLDEAARRIDRDPDGPEQRAWLGLAPRA